MSLGDLGRKMAKCPEGMIMVRAFYDGNWGNFAAEQVSRVYSDFMVMTAENYSKLREVMAKANADLRPERDKWLDAMAKQNDIVSAAVYDLAADTSLSFFFSEGKELYYEHLAKRMEEERLEKEEEASHRICTRCGKSGIEENNTLCKECRENACKEMEAGDGQANL